MKTFFLSACLLSLGAATCVAASSLGELEAKFAAIASAADGPVGVAATLLETGETATLRGDDRFPMWSVYKLPIAMAVLREVDVGHTRLDRKMHIAASELPGLGNYSPIRDRFPQRDVDLTIEELLRFMVSESDNTACDRMLREVASPKTVTTFVHEIGARDLAVVATEAEMAADEAVPYRNFSTPRAMVAVLRAVHESRGLSAGSHALLLKWMTETKTGAHRLKAGLPPGTVLAHKTGTSGIISGLARATNDAGLVTLPDGRHLVVVVFVSDSKADEATRERVIADIARAAWEFWAKPVGQ